MERVRERAEIERGREMKIEIERGRGREMKIERERSQPLLVIGSDISNPSQNDLSRTPIQSNTTQSV